MENKKSLFSLLIIVLVLILGVGYAVVSSVYLNISGSANVEDYGLKVEITSAVATSTIDDKVVDFSHVLSNKNLTSQFTLNGMELNETVSITYIVTNREKDIDAALTLTDGVNLTNSNNDYFEVNFEIIDDQTDLANNDKTMVVLVTVKLIKTPVGESGGSTTVGVTLTATPALADIELGSVTFNPENVSDYTLKATTQDNTSEFWGYKDKIKTIKFEENINIPIGLNENHLWDVSETGNGKVMAFIVSNMDDSTLYDLYIQGDGGIYANSDSSYLFHMFNKVESIDLDILNTSNVTNMNSMFAGAFLLTSLDLSHFDTSNVTDMSTMFNFNLLLSNLDVSSFNTTNVTNMKGMFGYTFKLSSLDVSSFDTSNVTSMEGMFVYAGNDSDSFSLNLGNNFDTRNVTDMSDMFYSTGFSSTEFTLNLGNKFDTSKVIDMSGMFSSTGKGSMKFTLDLGKKFNTSNVTNMSSMFSNTGYTNPSFTLILGSNFNTSKVTDMSAMFSYTGYNSTIFTLDLGKYFDTSNVTNISQMFQFAGYNSPLFNLDCRSWNVSKVTSFYGFNASVESKVRAPSSFNL